MTTPAEAGAGTQLTALRRGHVIEAPTPEYVYIIANRQVFVKHEKTHLES